MASLQCSAKSVDFVVRRDARDLSGSPIFLVEILHRILLSLGPRELVHLQTVSKQFRAVVNDPMLWKTLYTNARLPRPPGPYPWQSTKFLQRTLVRSARLAHCWTSHATNVVSMRLVTPEDDEECKWVSGRWSIGCIERRRLDLLDTDTEFEKTLYQSDDVRLISWAATSCNMSTRGLLLYVVLHTERHDRSGEKAELLEFRVDADTGQTSDPISFDVPMTIPEDVIIEVLSGDTPFVCIFVDPWRMRTAYALIFDTRSRVFYSFPEPISELNTEQPLSHLHYGEVILTATHVILCYMHSASTQFVRALVIPEDEAHELRITHETTIIMRKFGQWSLLRNSVVDPITGATRLRFLHEMTSSGHEYICTDITLPANPTRDVLPMSVDAHAVFDIDDHIHQSINPIEASVDGFARGLCVLGSSLKLGEIHVRKFSIDATGTRCVAVVGDSSTLSMPDPDEFEPQLMASFNGMRGRVCFSGCVPGDDMLIDAAVEFE